MTSLGVRRKSVGASHFLFDSAMRGNGNGLHATVPSPPAQPPGMDAPGNDSYITLATSVGGYLLATPGNFQEHASVCDWIRMWVSPSIIEGEWAADGRCRDVMMAQSIERMSDVDPAYRFMAVGIGR